MKQLLSFFAAFILLQACSNGTQGGEKDPAEVHPPSEAIPDSMQITNDSLISPDTVRNNGTQAGTSDSTQRN